MSMGEPDAIRIRGGVPLRGVAHVGADEQVLECALALAVLAEGRSELQIGRASCRERVS
jgi:hypothetical protein